MEVNFKFDQKWFPIFSIYHPKSEPLFGLLYNNLNSTFDWRFLNVPEEWNKHSLFKKKKFFKGTPLIFPMSFVFPLNFLSTKSGRKKKSILKSMTSINWKYLKYQLVSLAGKILSILYHIFGIYSNLLSLAKIIQPFIRPWFF